MKSINYQVVPSTQEEDYNSSKTVVSIPQGTIKRRSRRKDQDHQRGFNSTRYD